jgi:hypothetical protein
MAATTINLYSNDAVALDEAAAMVRTIGWEKACDSWHFAHNGDGPAVYATIFPPEKSSKSQYYRFHKAVTIAGPVLW